MAAFTLIFTPTTAVYGRSGYNKDGDDEEKDSGRSGYNKDGNDDDETQNKGRSGYNKDGGDGNGPLKNNWRLNTLAAPQHARLPFNQH
ncbi:hypothetical protein LX36DRAFT_708151 [Colletotrichum falcatum]|nr:hypothetical protein LX36DRAFT_708151 [Colletotrichum falcatum]